MSRPSAVADPAGVGARRVLLFEPYGSALYGNQQYCLLMLAELPRLGWEPLLVTTGDNALSAEASRRGCVVHVVAAPAGLHRRKRSWIRELVRSPITAWAYLAYAKALAKFLRQMKPTLIHCNNLRGLLLIGPAARLTGVPIVWYVKALDSPAWTMLGSRLAARALFLSDDLRSRVASHLPSSLPTELLPIGVSLSGPVAQGARIAQRQTLGISPDVFVIGTMSTITRAKRVHLLVQALGELKNRLSQAHLVVVGDAFCVEDLGYKDELVEQVERLGLVNSVTFLGWRPDARRLLNAFDVFVLASEKEGVPRSLVEAMDAGVPVVATAVGGVEGLLQHGHAGVILTAGTSTEIACAVQSLAEDRRMRESLVAAGRARADDFGLTNHMRGLATSYSRTDRRSSMPPG